VRLPPGLYAVRMEQVARIGTELTPDVARVPLGRPARIVVHIDTGIQ
jgi:hypothetical protein